MRVRRQSMLGQRDRFTGNILFYDYLYKTKRLPFLERNRRQVHSSRNEDYNEEKGFDFRATWRPPSWDLLNDMILAERAAGSFVLQAHGIRLQNGRQAPRGGRGNDLAKKARTLLRLTASIKTSVVSSSPDPPCNNPPEQEAILRATDRRSDREASIEMEPIIIYREDWHTDPGDIDENDIHRIMLSLNFDNDNNLKDLCEFMGLKISDSSARLSTSYGNIFDVPEGRVILPLKASGNQLGMGLEVSMHWNPLKRDSVLISHNRHLRNTIESSSSYPTPPLDQEPRYRLTFVYGNDTLERSELMCPHCSKKKIADIEDLKMHLISWHEYFDYHVTLEQVDEHGIEHWRFDSEVANYRAGQRASDTADEPADVRVLAPAQPFNRRKFLAGDDEFERTARIEKPTKHAKAKPATNGLKVAPGPRPRKPPDQVQSRPQREKKRFVVPKAPNGITFFRSVSKRPLQPGEVISESDDELDEGWMYFRKHVEIDKTKLSEASKRFLKIYDDFMHEENLQSEMHVEESIIRFARQCRQKLLDDNDVYCEFKKKMDELLEEDIISKEVHEALENIVNANELSQRLAYLDIQYRKTPVAPTDNGADQGLVPTQDQNIERNAMASNSASDPDHENEPILDWVASCVDATPEGNKSHQLRKDKGKGKAVTTEAGYLTPANGDHDGDVDMSDETSPNIPLESAKTPQDEDAEPPYDLCYCDKDASVKPGKTGLVACNNIVSSANLQHM